MQNVLSHMAKRRRRKKEGKTLTKKPQGGKEKKTIRILYHSVAEGEG